MTPCRFFAQGSCWKGDSCDFVHQAKGNPQDHLPPITSALPGMRRHGINQDTTTLDLRPKPRDKRPTQALSDSRQKIPCKFLSRPGGCQRESCPFLHTQDGHEGEESTNRYSESIDNEASNYMYNLRSTQDPHHAHNQDRDEDFTRTLWGASVYFDEFGQPTKISFPTDYSLACVTGLEPGTTPDAVVRILYDIGFDLDVDCVRISGHPGLLETKAMVKVEDPLFAQALSAKLRIECSPLVATPVAIDSKRTNCRKVYISWHKSTRSVWLNFGNCEIANRVAQKFNEGKYKCLGHPVRCSPARKSRSRGDSSNNPVAWTVQLRDVPRDATSADIKSAIEWPRDQPRHVELGCNSYEASESEVSTEAQLRLEEYGPLESFYFAPTCKGKRMKAIAWFQDEADARSASSLNNARLGTLGKGRLTVTLVHSAKVKVFTAVFIASKGKIEQQSKRWKELHMTIHVYPDSSQRFTTTKVEGDNAEAVADVRKGLDRILRGTVFTDGENAIWGPALSSNGTAYKKLKLIEMELDAIIVRDKFKRQLQFHGPPEKYQQAVRKITDILNAESIVSYGVNLDPRQFSYMVRGGFKCIDKELGRGVAVFDVISKRITVNGTHQQYTTVLAIIDGKHASGLDSLLDGSMPEGNCPICFCEAENPIQTSCGHTCCLECFEESCKSAASTSKDAFKSRCQGNEGNCLTVFTLRELEDHLPSMVFETVLKSSFKAYIQRHPETFHYCPTPDCGLSTGVLHLRPLLRLIYASIVSNRSAPPATHVTGPTLVQSIRTLHLVAMKHLRNSKRNLTSRIVLNVRHRWRRPRVAII